MRVDLSILACLRDYRLFAMLLWVCDCWCWEMLFRREDSKTSMSEGPSIVNHHRHEICRLYHSKGYHWSWPWMALERYYGMWMPHLPYTMTWKAIRVLLWLVMGQVAASSQSSKHWNWIPRVPPKPNSSALTRLFLEAQSEIVEDNNIVYQDNQSVMKIEKYGMRSCSKRTRHINIRYYCTSWPTASPITTWAWSSAQPKTWSAITLQNRYK